VVNSEVFQRFNRSHFSSDERSQTVLNARFQLHCFEVENYKFTVNNGQRPTWLLTSTFRLSGTRRDTSFTEGFREKFRAPDQRELNRGFAGKGQTTEYLTNQRPSRLPNAPLSLLEQFFFSFFFFWYLLLFGRYLEASGNFLKLGETADATAP
jgi:hypothetical protein